MSNKMTTTTMENFPVIDVTHRSKRTQSANLARAYGESSSVSESPANASDVPSVITIERAIQYFEEDAKGGLAPLYKQTSVWLRQLMSKGLKPSTEDSVGKALDFMSKIKAV